MSRPRALDDFQAIGRIAMKYGLLSPLLASAVVLSLGVAHADVLRLTSDTGQRYAGDKKRM